MDKLEEIIRKVIRVLIEVKPEGYTPTDMREVFTNAKLKN